MLTYFWWLLSDGFYKIMCIVSFNFSLYRLEAESIISKQYSVPSVLQVSLLTICAKMQDLLSVSKCYLIFVYKWRVVWPLLQALQPGETNLCTTKAFSDFGTGSFTLNISATLNGVKGTLIFKFLQ